MTGRRRRCSHRPTQRIPQALLNRESQVSPCEPGCDVAPHSIAFVCPGWPPGLGWPPSCFANGIVSYTRNMRLVLRSQGCRVWLIANYKGTSSAQEDDADVVWIQHDDERPPSWFRQGLRRIQRSLKPWSELATERMIGMEIARIARQLRRDCGLKILQMEESFGWARLVARLCEVPLVVRLHGPWFLNGSFDARRDGAFARRVRLEGEAISQAAGVSAPSHDILHRVREFYGIPLPDAAVIPIPMDSIPVSCRWSLETCRRHRILFVGRFDRHKGGDLVIEAFRRVLEGRPEARLSFAGEDRGIESPGLGRQDLSTFVESRLPGAIKDRRVEWLGIRTDEQLHQLRREAFVTVIASRYETFGNTLREAMIMGCPVVSSVAGGLADIIHEGRNALTFRNGDPADLARSLVRMIDHPEMAADLGRQAAEDCARHYDPDRIYQETIAFHREILSRRASSSSPSKGKSNSI